MRVRSLPLILFLVLGLLTLFPTAGDSWTSWRFAVIHRFYGGADGAILKNRVITDARGNLYGTTAEGGGCAFLAPVGCGIVFKLAPPTSNGGTWTETILHAFTGTDGYIPSSALLADPAGALYGTTLVGGTTTAQAGTVFQLERNGTGMYALRTLHTFTGGADGTGPAGELFRDARGNLYGETSGGGLGFGTIYKLAAPPAGSTTWTFATLYAFTGASGDGAGPAGGLIGGPFGSLYGVTGGGGLNGYGTVFTLTPPRPGLTAWTERPIFTFRSSAQGKHPTGPLLLDRNGNIYGTTNVGGTATTTGANCGNSTTIVTGCGTVFVLNPPTPNVPVWSEHVLYSFGSYTNGKFGPYEPVGSVVEDSRGQLYGTTSGGGANGGGTVYRLTPPAGGGFAYTETELESLGAPDGRYPFAGLQPTARILFGTTQGTGMFNDINGTVFELVAN